jgi:hypothetical protein
MNHLTILFEFIPWLAPRRKTQFVGENPALKDRATINSAPRVDFFTVALLAKQRGR